MTQKQFQREWFYKKINVSVKFGGRSKVPYLVTSCNIYEIPVKVVRSEGPASLVAEMTCLAPDYSPENAEWFTLFFTQEDLDNIDKIVRLV